MPELAQLAEAASEHQRLSDQAVRVGLEVDELERRQRLQEADVAAVVARRDRDRARLDAGSVSSSRELVDLQSEISALERRQAVLEDAQVELMEELEEVQGRAAEIEDARADAAARGRAARVGRDEQWAAIDEEAAGVRAERDAVAAELPSDLVASYERLRASHAGVGAAALRQGRCEGCRLQVDPADARRYAAAAPDEVLRCEECGRLLVRVEGSAGAASRSGAA